MRTLRLLDAVVLEQAVAKLTQPQTPADTAASPVVCGTRLQAQAVDGATNCGAPTHLVSLVQHGSGVTLAQAAIAHKRSELSAVPLLLAGRDLTDTITTSDAASP